MANIYSYIQLFPQATVDEAQGVMSDPMMTYVVV